VKDYKILHERVQSKSYEESFDFIFYAMPTRQIGLSTERHYLGL